MYFVLDTFLVYRKNDLVNSRLTALDVAGWQRKVADSRPRTPLMCFVFIPKRYRQHITCLNQVCKWVPVANFFSNPAMDGQAYHPGGVAMFPVDSRETCIDLRQPSERLVCDFTSPDLGGKKCWRTKLHSLWTTLFSKRTRTPVFNKTCIQHL